MNDQNVKYRRRNFFIDKSFQAKFIIKFCILVVVASLLIGALTLFLNSKTTTVAFENLKVVVKSTSDFILPTLPLIILTVSLFAGIATILITLFASHKIAGPLYRLTLELEKMKQRDFSGKVRIRADDQLQKVAGEFEELRIVLKDSLSKIQKEWGAIKPDIEKIKEDANPEKKENILRSIESIDSELEKFNIN